MHFLLYNKEKKTIIIPFFFTIQPTQHLEEADVITYVEQIKTHVTAYLNNVRSIDTSLSDYMFTDEPGSSTSSDRPHIDISMLPAQRQASFSNLSEVRSGDGTMSFAPTVDATYRQVRNRSGETSGFVTASSLLSSAGTQGQPSVSSVSRPWKIPRRLPGSSLSQSGDSVLSKRRELHHQYRNRSAIGEKRKRECMADGSEYSPIDISSGSDEDIGTDPCGSQGSDDAPNSDLECSEGSLTDDESTQPYDISGGTGGDTAGIFEMCELGQYPDNVDLNRPYGYWEDNTSESSSSRGPFPLSPGRAQILRPGDLQWSDIGRHELQPLAEGDTTTSSGSVPPETDTHQVHHRRYPRRNTSNNYLQ